MDRELEKKMGKRKIRKMWDFQNIRNSMWKKVTVFPLIDGPPKKSIEK